MTTAPVLIDELLAKIDQPSIVEVAGRTLSQARALAARLGYYGHPKFTIFSGGLCVLRFESPQEAV